MMTAAAPSFRPDALPAVTVPSLLNAGRRPAALRAWCRASDTRRCRTRGALLGRDLERDDFILELAGLLRRLGLLLRSGGELILFGARDVVLLGDVLGRDAHVVLVVDVPQAVDDHGVDQLGVAHAEAVARIGQHVRRGAHVFLAAGDDDVGVAALDGLGRQVGRLQAAAANFADGKRRHHVWQAGLDDGLARRVLAGAGGEHLAHDDFIDGGRIDTDPGQQGLDHVRAEVDGRDLCQCAAELADGGTASGDDYDIFHFNLRECWR